MVGIMSIWDTIVSIFLGMIKSGGALQHGLLVLLSDFPPGFDDVLALAHRGEGAVEGGGPGVAGGSCTGLRCREQRVGSRIRN